jgi:magnesium-transporting ATPase (P-type)
MNFAFLVGFGLQIFVVYVPGIRDLFEFTPLNAWQLLTTIGLSLVMVVIMEIVKLVKRIKNNQ